MKRLSILAKYNGKCFECGENIYAGDPIIYYPSDEDNQFAETYHKDCVTERGESAEQKAFKNIGE